MKALLFYTTFLLFFLFAVPMLYAQSDQVVANGGATTAVGFTGGGCIFHWVNSNPSTGLPATGTGDVPSFTAINDGTTPVTANITATPAPTGFAFIANNGTGQNSVSVINVSDNEVLATIPVGQNPSPVTINHAGTLAYAASQTNTGNTANPVYIISVINTKTYKVTGTIQVNAAPAEMVLSPDDSKLYVADYPDISVISTGTNTLITTFPINGDTGIAISPNGSTLYVSDGISNEVWVVNAARYTIVADVPVGYGPAGLAVSPNGKLLYVPDHAGNEVSVINTANNGVLAAIPVGQGPENVVFNASGSLAYVANESANTVSVINTTNNTVMATVPVGDHPIGLALTTDGSELLVTNNLSGDVSVVSVQTNTVQTKVPTSSGPASLGNFMAPGPVCGGQVSFTITVNPPANLSVNAAFTGTVAACRGAASVYPAIGQFAISGLYLTGNVVATAPPGFELSLTSAGGYASSMTVPPVGSTLSYTVIYVRSSASAPEGNLSGNVVLSSAGAASQSVAVTATVYATPVLNPIANQTVINGSPTAPVNFTGNEMAISWVNDTPGIGLAAGGTGNIPAFAAINEGSTPIVATITVTPFNTAACSGFPLTFTITVDPTVPPSLSATAPLNPLMTVYGTPSTQESFTVSGANLVGGIVVNPPPGFEVSSDKVNFGTNATVTGAATIVSAPVYIRLSAAAPVGDYQGQIIIGTSKFTGISVPMPLSTVTLAPLTITADNQVKSYGSPNPPLTVSYMGFVNADGPAQLTAQPVVVTSAATFSPVGKYPIIPDSAASPNYTISYVPGVLTVVPALSMLFIPNTFTPNGDGINDTWVIKYLDYYPRATVNIFNRSGQRLYSSTGYAVPWDGKYQGSLLPTGTYYYVIDPRNGQPAVSGWVAIVR